jgi:hypothetical protein
MTLKKEKRVWISELGAKNFFYPTDKFMVTEKDIRVKSLNFISSKKGLVALHVLEGDKNIKDNTVIWVDSKDLN